MQTVLLIAKAPAPGFAKSRLVGALGLDADGVARLADAFVRDTLVTCERVAPEQLVIAFTPPGGAPYFRALAPEAQLVAQVEGDLGARLIAAFEAAFALGATRVVAIGTDTPHLPPRSVTHALASLDDADCVLGPATDGGYYLIALTAPRPELLRGIEWSTPRVLAQTLERARASGLRVTCIDALHDVDDADDLERLAVELATRPDLCPHTARSLNSR